VRDEKDLLRRIYTLDEEALAQVFDTYYAPIYRYVYHHLGSVQSAQDITGEVFRRLLEALRDGKGPRRHLQAWLYRVAHNLVVDERRRSRYRNHLPLDAARAVAGEIDPEEQAESRIACQRVRAALGRLTPDQRQVIILRFLEGLSIREVSRIVGKPPGAVKALQHRALSSLRRHLLAKGEK